MKRISLVTLAITGALLLTAAIGSASASAEVLCKTAISPCPSSEVLPSGSWNTYVGLGEPSEEIISVNGQNTWPNFHCGYVALGEQTTAERGSPLPATGERLLDECMWGSGSVCKMSMSASSDQLRAVPGPQGVVTTGPLTMTATCGATNPFSCAWRGSYIATTSGAGSWRTETVEGNLELSSATVEAFCGGKTAALKTVPLSRATESYITL